MKRFILVLSCTLLAITTLAGCAASSRNFDSMPSTTTTYNEQESGGSQNTPAISRKILKNVNLSLEAKNVEEAYNDILAYAVGLGGYEFSRTQQVSGDITTVSAKIKIKPEHLDDFIAHIGSVSYIVNNQTSSEDITSDYYDARTRLDTMEKSLETYYDFLDSAKNIDESLKVQTQINDLTLRIESLKGQLNLWDSLLAESTVSIYLRQLSDPMQARREINWSTLTFDDMGYLMKSGLAALLNTVVVVLQWIAIILVVLSPLLIIGLIVLILVRKRIRRKRDELEKLKRSHQADATENGKR